MADEAVKSEKKVRSFLVAGDVCLDVVGVPRPPAAYEDPGQENWKLTGEVRTHLLPGGAMLLAEFVRNAMYAEQIGRAEQAAVAGKKDAEEIRWAKYDARRSCPRPAAGLVRGPTPLQPDNINAKAKAGSALSSEEFLEIAERLTRQDVVHSLLAVKAFPATAKKDDKAKVLRVEKCHGFSGPDTPPPLMKISYAKGECPDVIVLDDTGNRFRKDDPSNPWVSEITEPGGKRPLVVYKLHRPLPTEKNPNPLWSAVEKNHERSRVVVVSVDDIRQAGVPISLGLSWERTALDVVWHLQNTESLAALRVVNRLVVRLGLEGAVVWHRMPVPPMTAEEKAKALEQAKTAGRQDIEPRPTHEFRAWLVYDPAGIEGSLEVATPGSMVACGSAFTSAMAHQLSLLDDPKFSALLNGGPEKSFTDEFAGRDVNEAFLDAVEAGLLASRRIMRLGFGSPKSKSVDYPGPDLFMPTEDDIRFARHPIPIIPDVTTSDRGYWRLLESLFENRTALLHIAVENVALGKKVKGVAIPWKDEETASVAPVTPEDQRKAEEARKQTDAAHASWLLQCAPKASYGKLSTYDRREIEQYRSLYTLLRDYLKNPNPERPLSFAVFGPPGAGKSFGVKEVAESLKGQIGCKEVDPITFNLSLYQKPDELAAAFHLVRDKALKGKVPLVFFDEFDTSLDGVALGWLRYFLAPMQDGEFLDRETQHPIGPAIFVFAGGTSGTFKEFAALARTSPKKFKSVKGPDFLSRLRATLDIPSLNLLVAAEPESGSVQKPGTFDPYGPASEFPCTPAILLRRANILAFNLKKKAPGLERADESLAVDPGILRAMLLLPDFNHGNRSFEAILDMSHLSEATRFTPALLPAPTQLPLHSDADHFTKLVGTAYPFSAGDRDRIAMEIHRHYVEQRIAKKEFKPGKASHQPWGNLVVKFRDSNREQADDIPRKLHTLRYWLRKVGPARPDSDPSLLATPELKLTAEQSELSARLEHDRWVVLERRKGTIWGAKADPQPPFTHHCIVPWSDARLPVSEKSKDLDAIQHIPRFLAAAGYEVIKL